MKRFTILILILCVSAHLIAQTKVIFTAVNPYFFTNEQMWNFQILNLGKHAYSGNVEVTLNRNSTTLIKANKLLHVSLEKGVNIFTSAEKNTAQFVYGADPISMAFKNTNILTPGIYSFCVKVSDDMGKVAVYSCSEIQILGFTLPVLQTPFNGEQIQTPLPLFTWSPVMPATIYDLNYKIEIWPTGKTDAIKGGVNVYESNVKLTTMPYNEGLPQLQTGVNYSWIISAYSGDYYLGSSTVWKFSIGNTILAKEAEEEEDAFKIVGDHTLNADYLAENILRISYDNNANDSLMSYIIYHHDSLSSPIEELPEIVLKNGKNLINLDLFNTNKFISNERYTMEIYDGNDKKYYFNFNYVEL